MHSSLHPNSHHQINFEKFNLKLLYPPPYVLDIWYEPDANTDLIEWLICLIETEILEILMLMRRCLFSIKQFWILSNFILRKKLTVNDKEPLWFTKKWKTSSKRETMFIKAMEIVKTIIACNTWEDWNFFKNTYINKIEVSKLNYYSQATYKLTIYEKIQNFIGHY